MHRRLTLIEKLVLAALFGGALVYVLAGAAQDVLYVPGRNGGTYLRGIASWLLVPAPLLFWLTILVRHGLFERLSDRWRTTIEFTLLVLGVAFLLGALERGGPA